MKYQEINQTTAEGKLYCVAVLLLTQGGAKVDGRIQSLAGKTPQEVHEAIEPLVAKLYRGAPVNRAKNEEAMR